MRHEKQVPLQGYRSYPEPEMRRRATSFYEDLRRRRSVRRFSDRPVSREIIEDCLRAAGTAPSGANMQPWTFVVVTEPGVKRKIREAAEKAEREFYRERASEQWLQDLTPLGTGEEKPFLEKAPYLIAIFARRYRITPDGRKVGHYYVNESVGIATGVLITALHNAGLASLPYTPSPMGFLNDILGRPSSERPFLVLVVGYPADDAMVPDISRRPLEEIATFMG